MLSLGQYILHGEIVGGKPPAILFPALGELCSLRAGKRAGLEGEALQTSQRTKRWQLV